MRAVLLVAVLIGGVPVAAAQDDADAEARELFVRGREALGRGEYETALASFRGAYQLSPRPALLFNIGVAADRLRRDDEAIAAFEQYLRERPDAENRVEVEARLRVLRRQADGRRDAPPAPPPVAPTEPVDEGPGVTGQWWFWTAVALVAIAAAVTVVIVTTRDVPEDPLPGSLGGAVATLRW